MNIMRSGLLAMTVSAALLCAGRFAERVVPGALRAERAVFVRRLRTPRLEPPPAPEPVFHRRPPRPVSC